jgi:tetratricopeptide (TPR) repeat protein
VIQPCGNISNAVAVSYKGIRYILYDNEFMSEIANKTNTWSNTAILAHEVGHHINGHSVDVLLLSSDVVKPTSLVDNRQQELEADEFSGFILAKLGATLTQASEAINLLANDEDDSFSTHPSKSKRLNAIKIGFNNAMGNKPVKFEKTSTTLTAEEYFYRGFDKNSRKDYYGAISDYTKAIELNPNFVNAYYNRGNAKGNLNDNHGAISDFTKAIELNPNFVTAYFARGNAKGNLNDNHGAISDYTKAIELNPNDSEAYYNRGAVKGKLNDYQEAISDFTKAIELNPNFVTAYFARGYAKGNLNDYHSAISDYTKAIELNPNDAKTYHYRGALSILM